MSSYTTRMTSDASSAASSKVASIPALVSRSLKGPSHISQTQATREIK